MMLRCVTECSIAIKAVSLRLSQHMIVDGVSVTVATELVKD